MNIFDHLLKYMIFFVTQLCAMYLCWFPNLQGVCQNKNTVFKLIMSNNDFQEDEAFQVKCLDTGTTFKVSDVEKFQEKVPVNTFANTAT